VFNFKFFSPKASLGTTRKMEYLRKMRDALKLSCSDLQLKNGFNNFLRKYTDVKKKLNSSGFGIDPEKDVTLNKGNLILKSTCSTVQIMTY